MCALGFKHQRPCKKKKKWYQLKTMLQHTRDNETEQNEDSTMHLGTLCFNA